LAENESQRAQPGNHFCQGDLGVRGYKGRRRPEIQLRPGNGDGLPRTAYNVIQRLDQGREKLVFIDHIKFT
jgi:hypothetical protein